jgi:alkylated DNA repair dioxygenase AlkB
MNQQGDLFSDLCAQNQAAETIALEDATLRYWPAFTAADISDNYFSTLLTQTHWQQDHITLHGKTHAIPRLQSWFGSASYSYSGLKLQAQALNPTLLAIKQNIERQGYAFNSLLANLYRDGNDSVGWHADDEKELGRNPIIASYTLGTSRRFLLKHKKIKTLKHGITLNHGDLLIMEGVTQHHWLHCLPKTTRPVAARINLTFRNIMTG